MLLQSSNPQNPPKNKKKNGKGFEISEAASPRSQKTTILFFGEPKINLAEKR